MSSSDRATDSSPASPSAEALPSTNASTIIAQTEAPATPPLPPTPPALESTQTSTRAPSPVPAVRLSPRATEGNASEPSTSDNQEPEPHDGHSVSSALPPTPTPSESAQARKKDPSPVPAVRPYPRATEGNASEPSTPDNQEPEPQDGHPVSSALPPTPTPSESAQARKKDPSPVPAVRPYPRATKGNASEPSTPDNQEPEPQDGHPVSSALPPTPPPSESIQTRKRAPSPAPVVRTSQRATKGNASEPTTPDNQEPEPQDGHPASTPDPIDQLLAADRPPLPTPRSPPACPLFCCFYAEFDIVVGPKVAYQSPKGFMDQDTGIPTDDIHELLEDTFKRVQAENEIKRKERETEKSGKDEGGQSDDGGAGTSAVDDDSQEGTLSIFDATSEYVITGNELAGKMINLSTHNMHILTRPTVIADERYERNALHFCVGFVIRRSEDPRPFRPLLCKWADALRSMEVENHFLTNPKLRWQLQPMLDRLLVSINSLQWEANLLLDSANALNLRAFRPPKPPALPVPDYAVPVLIREDLLSLVSCKNTPCIIRSLSNVVANSCNLFNIQYDWDLAIKWVVLFIDGVNHARWISTKSDVDMEMVRACLRVLKHHGVIELVDMFFYSNRYEFTERATSMLAGKEPKLLQEAMEYITRSRQGSETGTPPAGVMGELGAADSNPGAVHLSSSARQTDRSFHPISEEMVSPSFPPMARSIPSSFMSAASFQNRFMALPSEAHRSHFSRSLQKRMKLAIAEMYCSCNRNVSFADLRIAKVTESGRTSSMVNKRDSGQAITHMDLSTGLGEFQESSGRERFIRRISESDRSADFRKKSDSGHLDPSRKSSKDGVDWKEAFEALDHRRFANFGVVHGLLRRVHNYPLAVEARNADEVETETFRQASFEEKKEAATLYARDRANISRRSRSFEKEHPGRRVSAARVATMMDGTRCDDELICEFERPLHELFQDVEATGRKVVSIHAVAPA